jgi:hypothetical protein
MNEKGNSTNAVTSKVTTEAAIICPVQIIFYTFVVGMDKLNFMIMSCLLAGCLSCQIMCSCLIEYSIIFHG